MSPIARDLENSILTRRQALRAAGAGAAALLGGGALAACGSSSASSSASGSGAASGGGGKLTTVTDQLGWLKTSQWAGFYAAINNGYYKAEGIDENLISGGPNIIASSVVGAGHATVGEDDNNTVLQAIAKGEPLVIFGDDLPAIAVLDLQLSEQADPDPEGFRGQEDRPLACDTCRCCCPLLKKAGVDTGSVSFVPAVNVAQFTNHQVDGYFGFSTNEGTVIKQQGINFITTPNWDLGLKSYGNVLITSQGQPRPRSATCSSATCVPRSRAGSTPSRNPNAMGPLTVQKFAAPGDNVKTETAQAVAQVALIKNAAGVMRITPALMQEVIDGMRASEVALQAAEGLRRHDDRASWTPSTATRPRSRSEPAVVIDAYNNTWSQAGQSDYLAGDEYGVERMLAAMDAAGVDKAVACSLGQAIDNAYIASIQEAWPKRIIGFGQVNPRMPDAAGEVGTLRGRRAARDQAAPDDARLPLLRPRSARPGHGGLCRQRQLVVLVNALDDPFCAPLSIEEIVRSFPDGAGPDRAHGDDLEPDGGDPRRRADPEHLPGDIGCAAS